MGNIISAIATYIPIFRLLQQRQNHRDFDNNSTRSSAVLLENAETPNHQNPNSTEHTNRKDQILEPNNQELINELNKLVRSASSDRQQQQNSVFSNQVTPLNLNELIQGITTDGHGNTIRAPTVQIESETPIKEREFVDNKVRHPTAEDQPFNSADIIRPYTFKLNHINHESETEIACRSSNKSINLSTSISHCTIDSHDLHDSQSHVSINEILEQEMELDLQEVAAEAHEHHDINLDSLMQDSDTEEAEISFDHQGEGIEGRPLVSLAQHEDLDDMRANLISTCTDDVEGMVSDLDEEISIIINEPDEPGYEHLTNEVETTNNEILILLEKDKQVDNDGHVDENTFRNEEVEEEVNDIAPQLYSFKPLKFKLKTSYSVDIRDGDSRRNSRVVENTVKTSGCHEILSNQGHLENLEIRPIEEIVSACDSNYELTVLPEDCDKMSRSNSVVDAASGKLVEKKRRKSEENSGIQPLKIDLAGKINWVRASDSWCYFFRFSGGKSGKREKNRDLSFFHKLERQLTIVPRKSIKFVEDTESSDTSFTEEFVADTIKIGASQLITQQTIENCVQLLAMDRDH